MVEEKYMRVDERDKDGSRESATCVRRLLHTVGNRGSGRGVGENDGE